MPRGFRPQVPSTQVPPAPATVGGLVYASPGPGTVPASLAPGSSQVGGCKGCSPGGGTAWAPSAGQAFFGQPVVDFEGAVGTAGASLFSARPLTTGGVGTEYEARPPRGRQYTYCSFQAILHYPDGTSSVIEDHGGERCRNKADCEKFFAKETKYFQDTFGDAIDRANRGETVPLIEYPPDSRKRYAIDKGMRLEIIIECS